MHILENNAMEIANDRISQLHPLFTLGKIMVLP